jgi:hypothetical protein
MFSWAGFFILVIALMQAEKSITCPYHLLSRLVRRASVISCIPSLAQNNVVGVSSPGLVLQIQQIIALSGRRRILLNSSWWSLFGNLAFLFQTYLWVLNEEHEFERAFKLGATGVMTDFPTKLKEFLDKNPQYRQNAASDDSWCSIYLSNGGLVSVLHLI